MSARQVRVGSSADGICIEDACSAVVSVEARGVPARSGAGRSGEDLTEARPQRSDVLLLELAEFLEDGALLAEGGTGRIWPVMAVITRSRRCAWYSAELTTTAGRFLLPV